jgi:endonuclease YncB( thermonuclease family)
MESAGAAPSWVTGPERSSVSSFRAATSFSRTSAKCVPLVVQRLEEAFVKAGIAFVYEDDTRGPGILLSKELSRRLGQPSEASPKKTRRKGLKETK